MRKLLAAAVVLAAIGTTGIGQAEEPIVLEGAIQIGTVGEVGLTRSDACNTESADQGFDGYWLSVADDIQEVESVDGFDAVLTVGEPYNDADVFFFDVDCIEIAYDDMAQNFIAADPPAFEGNAEMGVVPTDTAFILVEGFFGLQMSFALTLTPPGPDLPELPTTG